MNKRGFTLVELLAVIIIMSLIMMMSFPSIQGMIKTNNKKKYEAYERSMHEYAKAYYEDETAIIGLESLRNEGLTGIDSECIGYVDPVNNYKAYLKCLDDYQTEGFSLEDAN